ncbi:WD40/YVTN repeat-like-containing domain [Lasallia pustulata]|uniref:WD40/YVTN repeat-like-containing domain n=1 Tax=Lasallia pustulata TaxID=136370 RepID=A0A1W5D3L2_9LECA|nr:WD40/YVTN repeat-like-containing domain [Lasallia pustulata]
MAAPPPPPAPPLPPQRYGNRAANALVRFAQPFIYGSRPPSAQGNGPGDEQPAKFRLSVPRSSISPSSRNATHRTGIPIAALDISPCKTHAIVAGRDILKTIRVSGHTCAEDLNLRSSIVAYASNHNPTGNAISAKSKDQLAANDVKWSHGAYDSTIATAAANGRIVLYDINRTGVELARLHEHYRQVHKLAFNPHKGNFLLSGSQDATMKFWDLRELTGERSVMTCRSVHTYPGNNEGIRDLRWSPTDGMEFAAGTDNGVIQRWDLRKANAPLLKINAHEKTCHSVDWHPDGKHLVSGGADKNVKVWDFTSTDRRMTPSYHLRAPQAVLNVRWRPACWTTEGQVPGNWQCTQLVTSYDHHDPRVHIWDFRRPYMPFQELDRYDVPPTDVLWRSDDLLWTVGTAGMFTQTDIHFVPKLEERRSVCTVTAAPNGQICFFVGIRTPGRRSIEDSSAKLLALSKRGSIGDKLSSSHSATDGSLEEASLLSSSFKKRHQKSASMRSSKSFSSTPPSNLGNLPLLKFDEAMKKDGVYLPAQVAAYGHVIGVFDSHAFKYLARNYEQPPVRPELQVRHDLHREFSHLFEANALLAAHVGQYRLAQSWRILALAVQKELQTRADTNACARRLMPPDWLHQTKNLAMERRLEKITLEKARTRGKLLNMESSSNLSTPLARPLQDTSNLANIHETVQHLEEDESQRLPLPLWGVTSKHVLGGMHTKLPYLSDRQASEIVSDDNPTDALQNRAGELAAAENYNTASKDPTNPRTDVLQIISPVESSTDIAELIEERRAAIGTYRSKARPLLQLDQPLQLPNHISSIPRLDRHDSTESFQMFSASTDSSNRATSMAGSFNMGSFNSTQKSDDSGPTPERWNDTIRSNFVNQHIPASNVAAQNFPGSPAVEGVDQPLPESPQEFSQLDGQETISFREDTNSSPRSSPEVLRPTTLEPPIVHILDTDPVGSAPLSSADQQRLENDAEVSGFFVPSDFDYPLTPLSTTTSNAVKNPAPDIPPSPPWTASAMLPQIMSYHTTTLSDVQLPAFLIIYLQPYFDPFGTNSIFPYHYCNTILQTYHSQLRTLDLHVEAALLRNQCAKLGYPDVAEHGTLDIQAGGAWCPTCRRPAKGDKKKRRCERCKQPWGACSICHGAGPLSAPGAPGPSEASARFPRGAGALWCWCPRCGHGGHAGCLRLWWSDAAMSEGGCAMQGCLKCIVLWNKELD